MNQFIIRSTRLDELDQVMAIYDRARQFMIQNGNANQWINGYPASENIRQDIEAGHSFVMVDACDEPEACFAFMQGEDPCYKVIVEGNWLNDEPYGVIHRVASHGRTKGVMDACIDWCNERCANLRVDTHRDNHVLQSILRKKEFTYCGIVFVKNGTERLAYQRAARV